MKREVLYRAKVQGSGEWVYGYYYKLGKHIHRIKPIDKDGNITGGECPIDIVTLSEYTGLKDKNGVKIFEGDILASHYPWLDEKAVLGVVEYGNGTFDSGVYIYTGFYIRDKEGNVDHTSIYQKDIDDSDIEVIGNIYDNPELLADKKK